MRIASDSTVAAIQAALGEHPEDIVATLAAAAQVLGELEAMLHFIGKDLAQEPALAPRALTLAGAGKRLAAEAAEQATAQAAAFRRRLSVIG